MKFIPRHLIQTKLFFLMIILVNSALFTSVCTQSTLAFSKVKTPQYPEMDVAWAQPEADRIAIFIATKNQGKWSHPEKIQDLSADDLHPTVDRDQLNRIWLAWTAIDYQDFRIHYTVKEANVWQPPAAVPTTTENNIAPYLLVIDTIPWLVWAGNNDDDDDIYYSRFINGQWEPARLVHSDNTYPDILPRLDVSASGQPVVSWEQYSENGYIAVSRTWDGSTWSTSSADSQLKKMTTTDKEIIYSVPGRMWDGRQWIKSTNTDEKTYPAEKKTVDAGQASTIKTITLPDYLQKIKTVYIRIYHQ